MSDRVFFGARNDTGTPADSSGFNGFPFPLPEWDGGSVTTVPQAYIAVPFATAIKWFWRVKKWRIQVSVSLSGSHDSGSPSWSGTLTSDVIKGTRYVSFPTRVTSELDLLKQNMATSNVLESASSNGPVTVSADGEMDWLGGPSGASVGTNLAMSSDQSLFRDGSNIRYPITCGDAVVFSGGDTVGDAFGFFSSGSTFYPATNFTAYVDGLPMTFQFYSNPASGTDLATIVSAISVTIDPYEYWPYASAAGAAIYSTTTGALLSGRTPLS